MQNKNKQRRLMFVGTVFAISLAALIFVIVNFRDQIVFFYSPSELQNPAILTKAGHSTIRVGGLVEEGSVKKIDALTTEFTITDMTTELRVVYKGLLPDLFRDKQGVVATGRLDVANQQFVASELLVKHDEKYMPPEVARALSYQ